MKKLLLPSILAIALMPTFSSQAQDDSCFMVLSNGKRINLGGLCGKSSSPQPQQTIPPTIPASQTIPQPQPKQARCQAGYKFTKNETCRDINAPIVSVSGIKLLNNPDNEFLPYVNYTITNLVEVPVSVSTVVIRFTSPSGATTNAFLPLIILQPNESITLKETTSAIYSLGVKAKTVTLSLDRVDALEKS